VYTFASEILRFGHAKVASSLMETVAASRPELEPKVRAWWFMTASNFAVKSYDIGEVARLDKAAALAYSALRIDLWRGGRG
jgi:hypothetical protein